MLSTIPLTSSEINVNPEQSTNAAVAIADLLMIAVTGPFSMTVVMRIKEAGSRALIRASLASVRACLKTITRFRETAENPCVCFFDPAAFCQVRDYTQRSVCLGWDFPCDKIGAQAAV